MCFKHQMTSQVDLYKRQAVSNEPQTVNQINNSTTFIDEEEEGEGWRSTNKLRKTYTKLKKGNGVNTTTTSDEYSN